MDVRGTRAQHTDVLGDLDESMKILIAPDSFKGSLSAARAAEAIAAGVRRALPDAQLALIPLADGGEGTVEAFATAVGGRVVPVPATGPLGEKAGCFGILGSAQPGNEEVAPVRCEGQAPSTAEIPKHPAFIGVLDDGRTAVIEMAAASGLPLVPEDRRNPMLTTSYGTGELIAAALDLGCERIILGIGGSATNDGGVGMIQALGGSFKDETGAEIGFGGGELARIRSIDVSRLDSRLESVAITIACDVDNPLTGPRGASAVFGPQKGATPDMVAALDAGLANLAEVIRRDLGIDVENAPGAGAAGGLGAAALAFLGAELKPGIEIVLDVARFDDALRDAALVFTGEGRVDAQTLQGKVINGVLRAARARGVPVIVLAGGVEPEGYDLIDAGAAAVLSIVDRPMSLDEACERAAELLERAAEQAVRLFCLG